MPSRRAVTGRSQEPRARFAEELRSLRRTSGLSLREVGNAIRFDFSHVARMESGESLAGPELVQALDSLYGTNYLLILWEIAQKDASQFRLRYRRYMEMENEATSIQIHSPGLIPGLLQSREYAEQLLITGGLTGPDLERQVDARLGRQEKLNGNRPPQLRAILSEAVLRTPITNEQHWRQQLRKLLAAAEQPNIIVQVVPLSTGPHVLSSTYVNFLRLPEGRTVAWIETSHSSELVEETATVEQLQLSYDRVRDRALSPDASRQLIHGFLEDVPCDPAST
ncbi:helix-turn-helix domain-containing protein [Streptomyces lonarensis]|uniref:Helix-turn-helix domain-containing protein n=1 Tax=Streptomyces lonarensis TaxID=700599 RepID=A0A7X6D0T6_9ACTN|nr:helix-turn-helix transcriptional regulator [Streptomyces lonarensis]NJQ06114.1 helix-turn-helix domain-containing protein [Streptomyces lonarensis]